MRPFERVINERNDNLVTAYMTYLQILIVSGALVAPFVSGLIYYDTARRSLSSSIRLSLVALFGIGSFGGFLVPYLFNKQLSYFYHYVIQPEPIAVTPIKAIRISIGIGVLCSLLLVGVYLVSTRFVVSETE